MTEAPVTPGALARPPSPAVAPDAEVALLPRLLGALFYRPPAVLEMRPLLDQLPHLPDLFPWRNVEAVRLECLRMPDWAAQAVQLEFETLFEAQGNRIAPPWGSVYLDRDNLLMGPSTARYRDFLSRNGLSFAARNREPEDQFGLMLLAFAWLLEAGRPQAARDLLEQHLMPWSGRYLERLRDNGVSPAYAWLAGVAGQWLEDLRATHDLHPATPRLFY
ncbi:MAG: molecular chaperone [Telmatospirillum sp.]|nr:molecular chaperone [Telmatospirillum sp.]